MANSIHSVRVSRAHQSPARALRWSGALLLSLVFNSGCSLLDPGKPQEPLDPVIERFEAYVQIVTPLNGSTINGNTAAQITVTGFCNKNQERILFSSDVGNPTPAETLCANGGFSVALNFQALPDGAIQLQADYATGGLITANLTLIKDTQPPAAPALVINEGAPWTTQREVTLGLFAESATRMCVAESADCSGCVEDTYATSKSFTLSQGGGTKTVSVKYSDSALNSSACVSSSITLGYPIQVVSRYQNDAGKWNDYIQANDSAPCSGTTNGYDSCLHAGEARKVVTQESSCADLALSDSLGVFDWTCSVQAGKAVFAGQLKKTTRLSQLLDWGTPLAFKNNTVTLTGCTTCPLSSTPARWWSNAVQYAPDSTSAAQSLSSASTIYGIGASTLTSGYSLAADRVALVVKEGAQLTWNASAPALLCGTTSFKTLICSRSRSYTWLEGRLSGGSSTLPYSAISTADGKFSRFQDLQLENTLFESISSSGKNQTFRRISQSQSSGRGPTSADQYSLFEEMVFQSNAVGPELSITGNLNRLTQIRIDRTASPSINFAQAISISGNQNKLTQVSIAGVRGQGALPISIYGNQNRLSQLKISNSARGISLSNAQNTRISDAHFDNIDGSAIGSVGSKKTTVSRVRLTNSGGGYNLWLGSGTQQFSAQAITVSNIQGGAAITYPSSGATLSRFHNLLSANSSSPTVSLQYSSPFSTVSHVLSDRTGISLNSNYTKVSGHLALPSVTSCEASEPSATNPGITHGNCAQPQGTSDYQWTPTAAMNFSHSIVGKITSDDTANASDNQGQATFSSTLDWFQFENAFRSWGLEGGAFPSLDNQGVWTSGAGRVWDYSLLAATDNPALNRTGSLSARNSSSDPQGNYVFPLEGGACPLEVRGSVALTPQPGCTSPSYTTQESCTAAGQTWLPATPYLANAIEYWDETSTSGNFDGLCQSGETCLYTPNFGAYQGHGDLVPCTFDSNNGAITGVTMLGYTQNGRSN